MVTVYQAVIEDEHDFVTYLLDECINLELDPHLILREGLIAPMGEIGSRFENGEISIPEMLLAGVSDVSRVDDS